MKTLEILLPLVISLKIVYGQPLDITNSTGLKSKCSDSELKQTSDNYEECIQITYTEMNMKRAKDSESNEILKKSTKSDAKEVLSAIETLSEDENVLCQALDKLINNCTAEHLGWCYTDEHVRATMREQREVSRSALAKMEIFCPESEETTTTTTISTTTTIRTTTSTVTKPSELPHPAHPQTQESHPEPEPGAAPTMGFSFTLLFISIAMHLILYK